MSSLHLPSPSVSPTSIPPPRSPSLSNDREDDDDDEDTLPYPAELQRSDFLTPAFDPQTYLSTLRNRHQTLEDLRADLRQRSQLLNNELLDLVNGNYEDFLSLGEDLEGGEEKVEDVRVGVLGFRREVEGIRKGVRERAAEVAGLLSERKLIRRDVMLGRNLLEMHARVGDLEESLGIKPGAEDDEDLDDEEDEEDNGMIDGVQVGKVQTHVRQYLLITHLADRIGAEHPFCVNQGVRLDAISRTILLDLTAALKQAQAKKSADAILAIAKLYSDIGAEEESIRVLKGG